MTKNSTIFFVNYLLAKSDMMTKQILLMFHIFSAI